MKYLLDTDHCIALAKKSHAIMEALNRHPPSKVRAGSITIAELHSAAARSKHPDIAAANIRRILKTHHIVPFDEAAAESYGTIRADLERRGSPIGPLDTLIAGHARSLGWMLVTHNAREFKLVPSLLVEDWLVGPNSWPAPSSPLEDHPMNPGAQNPDPAADCAAGAAFGVGASLDSRSIRR